jgi:hypothetical protein
MEKNARDRDRYSEIIKKLNIEKLPFKVTPAIFNELSLEIADSLTKLFKNIGLCSDLKWCLSTVKKAKVFLIIYQANERAMPIYKEEISKKLPEYSYKTIANIIDEGVAKNYYVTLDPVEKKISDKKVKNIRPSLELITAFYNYNIERIATIDKLIKKFQDKN